MSLGTHLRTEPSEARRAVGGRRGQPPLRMEGVLRGRVSRGPSHGSRSKASQTSACPSRAWVRGALAHGPDGRPTASLPNAGFEERAGRSSAARHLLNSALVTFPSRHSRHRTLFRDALRTEPSLRDGSWPQAGSNSVSDGGVSAGGLIAPPS